MFQEFLRVKVASGLRSGEEGFTLVEMIVAVALFAIVMMVSVGALLALSAANKKAQALQSVMNNLNISLDSMVRNLRTGTDFYCGVGAYQPDGAGDCSGGGPAITFTCNPATPDCVPGNRWAYQFYCPVALTDGACPTQGSIQRSEENGTPGTWEQITSPDISISSMAFYVVGTAKGDDIQPKAIIVIEGNAGGGSAKTQTSFHLQTTAVQRQLDL